MLKRPAELRGTAEFMTTSDLSCYRQSVGSLGKLNILNTPLSSSC